MCLAQAFTHVDLLQGMGEYMYMRIVYRTKRLQNTNFCYYINASGAVDDRVSINGYDNIG